jgi:hypothetical protein
MDFGFYPKPFDQAAGGIAIRTLDGLDDKVRAVMDDGGIDNDWCYAPPQERRWMGGTTETLPHPSRVFGLPKTHALDHASPHGDDHLRFLIQCFGFFAGMRLTETEMGFLDATPIKPGMTNDIVWFGDSLMKALTHADYFWQTHKGSPRISAAVRGVIHNSFLAATPTHLDFERFIYLYVALEGCHYIRSLVLNQNPRKGTHGERIANLCGAYGMPVPGWADPSSPGVAAFRHETLHEGLFFDEPFGFQIYGGNAPRPPQYDNVPLEMSHLISRLVMALLGMEKSDYVISDVTTRQRMGVRL